MFILLVAKESPPGTEGINPGVSPPGFLIPKILLIPAPALLITLLITGAGFFIVFITLLITGAGFLIPSIILLITGAGFLIIFTTLLTSFTTN